MKTTEQLFKQVLGFKFDTPKKLNRSTKPIPTTLIEDLEDGKFTCEAIEKLTEDFPVFRYQTCITIHGAWDEIKCKRIGGYKNVHQNQNGSVEIRYSAIDLKKIQTIRENTHKISSFRFYENSTDRYFAIQLEVTKETFDKVRGELQPIAERLTKCNIYGHVSLFVSRDLYRTYICLLVYPLAIPENEVHTFTLELCGLNQEQWEIKIAERRKKEDEENKIWLEEENKRKIEQAERLRIRNLQLNQLKPQIAHLPSCSDINSGALVSVDEYNPSFIFYRKDANGSFGRVNWSKAVSSELPTDLNQLTWKPQKQIALKDLRLKNCKLIQR